jgi:hypothetical protein
MCTALLSLPFKAWCLSGRMTIRYSIEIYTFVPIGFLRGLQTFNIVKTSSITLVIIRLQFHLIFFSQRNFQKLFLLLALEYPGFLMIGASNHNGYPARNYELKMSQLFVQFPFVLVNDLKFVKHLK